jgi:hypothetical protein
MISSVAAFEKLKLSNYTRNLAVATECEQELQLQDLLQASLQLELIKFTFSSLTHFDQLFKLLSENSNKLTALDLSNNYLDDQGLESLCNYLVSSNCQLKTLSLTGNKISCDQGLDLLASALGSCPSLVKLDILGVANVASGKTPGYYVLLDVFRTRASLRSVRVSYQGTWEVDEFLEIVQQRNDCGLEF